MKKFILGLAFMLVTSCSAQQFERSEYFAQTDTTTTAILTQVDEETASFVTRDYKIIFETDAKPDMIKGYEYIIRIQFDGNEFKRNGVNRAKLVGYTISPAQANRNAASISRGL